MLKLKIMSPIKKLIKPDTTEIILYLGIGFGMLVVNNIQKFWSYLSSGADIEQVITYSDAAFEVQQKLLDLEAGIDPRLADFTVWMIIGVLSISTVFIAQKVLGDSSEEIRRASMLRKTHYKKIVTQETAYRLALRIAGILLFLIWFRLFFGSIFSRLSDLFLDASLNLFSLQVIYLPFTVIFAGLGIYVFAICARLIALKIRVFN